MVNYICPRCHYESSHKNDIRKHYLRKKVCRTEFSRISVKDCLEELETKDKILISRDNYNKLSNKTINKLINSIKAVNSTVNFADENGTITNNNNNNTINVNVIKVNAYEDTDYSYMKNHVDECIVNGELDVRKVLKLLHFNEDHPENHNMYIKDIRTKTVMLYDGVKFLPRYSGKNGFKFLVEDIFTKYDKHIHKHAKELVENNKTGVLETYRNLGGSIVLEHKNEGKFAIQRINDCIFDMSFNHKELMKRTHKKIF